MKAKVERSLNLVAGWVEENGYTGYDPGDGQLSFLRHFAFRNHFLERLLTGGVFRTPFNIRPLLGIAPHTSPKGMGYMAWGYLRRYRLTGDERFARRAVACLDWLIEHRAPYSSEFCWGNHYTVTTRADRTPRREPTMVDSSLIGQVFVDAYEMLGNERYRQVASSVCDWILSVPREKTDRGHCLSHLACQQMSIHSSNMLGAALLARVGSLMNRSREEVDVVRDAMLYSCSRQRQDGAWFYGEGPQYQWMDNFHTGYCLDSLKGYTDCTGKKEFADQLQRGYCYFKQNFFEADGRPKYHIDRTYPIDIQCAAQSIDTLALFSDCDGEALDIACKVADWTIDNIQAPEGYFYYRDLGWKTIRTPMLHQGQGTMFKALAHLAAKLTWRLVDQPSTGTNLLRHEAAPAEK